MSAAGSLAGFGSVGNQQQELDVKLQSQRDRNAQLRKQIQVVVEDNKILQETVVGQRSSVQQLQHQVISISEMLREEKSNHNSEMIKYEAERHQTSVKNKKLSEQLCKYPLVEQALRNLLDEVMSSTVDVEFYDKTRISSSTPLSAIEAIRISFRLLLSASRERDNAYQAQSCLASKKQNETDATINNIVNTLKSEKQEVENQLSALEQSHSHCAGEREELVVAYKKQIQQLKKVETRMRMQLATLTSQLTLLRGSLEKAQHKIAQHNNAEQEMAALEQEINRVRAYRERDTRQNEKHTLRIIESLNTKFNKQQLQLSKKHITEAEVADLHKKLKTLSAVSVHASLKEAQQLRTKTLNQLTETKCELKNALASKSKVESQLRASEKLVQTMTVEYNTIFASQLKQQELEAIKQSTGYKDEAIRKYAGNENSDSVSYYRAKFDDAQTEVNFLSQQLRKCLMLKQHEKGKFESERQVLIKEQHQLCSMVEKLRSEVSNGVVDEQVEVELDQSNGTVYFTPKSSPFRGSQTLVSPDSVSLSANQQIDRTQFDSSLTTSSQTAEISRRVVTAAEEDYKKQTKYQPTISTSLQNTNRVTQRRKRPCTAPPRRLES